MQSAMGRRKKLLEMLMYKRQETVHNLAFELNVSERTIRRDICILKEDYPIYTAQGNGGCVYIEDGYYDVTRHLSSEEKELLDELSVGLHGHKAVLMKRIIRTFAKVS